MGPMVAPYLEEERQRQAQAAAPQAQEPGLLQMPQLPLSQMAEEDGRGKVMGKTLLNMLSGGLLTPFLFPDLQQRNAEYMSDLGAYKNQQDLIKKIQAQEALASSEAARVSGLGRAVIEAKATPDTADDLAAYNDYLAGGGTSEGLNRIAGKMPEFQVVDNNGTPTLFDKNNPESRGIPMRSQDGSVIHKAPDQWMIKQAGAFDRMAPRLQELDEMERGGVTIDRNKMTELRAMEAADAAGDRVLATKLWQEWMDVTLSPEERAYVLAAEDAGMVVLRDESGAAISASEILRQMNQYMMFSDYDTATMVRQRNARNRKAQTLIRDLPDYVRKPRQDWIDWVDSFDGGLSAPEGSTPNLSPGNDVLPPMTQEQMARYLSLSKSDPTKAARLVELIRLTQEQ